MSIVTKQVDGSRCHLVRTCLGPGDIVLDGAQLPPPKKKGTAPQFSAHVYCDQTVAHLSYCCALVETHFQGRVGEAKGGTSPTPDSVENYCCSELNYFSETRSETANCHFSSA